MADLEQTLKERGERYGKFVDHAAVTMALKNVFGSYVRRSMSADQVEALHMICHKLGRIAAGDLNYADSWLDIAGYAKLVADRLEGEAK